MNHYELFSKINNDEQLYQAMINLVEEVITHEKQKRAKIQEEYDAATKPYLDAYNNATVDAKRRADAIIEKEKAIFRKEADKIMKRAQEKIDKLEHAMKVSTQTAIELYNMETATEQKDYHDATAQFSSAAEAEMEKLAKESERLIEPINEAYRKRAEELGLVIQ